MCTAITKSQNNNYVKLFSATCVRYCIDQQSHVYNHKPLYMEVVSDYSCTIMLKKGASLVQTHYINLSTFTGAKATVAAINTGTSVFITFANHIHVCP